MAGVPNQISEQEHLLAASYGGRRAVSFLKKNFFYYSHFVFVAVEIPISPLFKNDTLAEIPFAFVIVENKTEVVGFSPNSSGIGRTFGNSPGEKDGFKCVGMAGTRDCDDRICQYSISAV